MKLFLIVSLAILGIVISCLLIVRQPCETSAVFCRRKESCIAMTQVSNDLQIPFTSNLNVSKWKTHGNELYKFTIQVPASWMEANYSTPSQTFFIEADVKKNDMHEIGSYSPSFILSYFLRMNDIHTNLYQTDWLISNYRNRVFLKSGMWAVYTAGSNEGVVVTYSTQRSMKSYNFTVHDEDENMLSLILDTLTFY